MADKFVNDVGGKYKVPLKSDANKTVATLLWGDRVRVISTSGDTAKVRARGRTGFMSKSVLTDESLLELYVIDVGQGDGVLMRTSSRPSWSRTPTSITTAA